MGTWKNKEVMDKEELETPFQTYLASPNKGNIGWHF